jgi:hypothetical protein
MLKFSKESVQTLSGERPKTAQRTLFLSFEINNCLQISAQFELKQRYCTSSPMFEMTARIDSRNVWCFSKDTSLTDIGSIAVVTSASLQ